MRSGQSNQGCGNYTDVVSKGNCITDRQTDVVIVVMVVVLQRTYAGFEPPPDNVTWASA